MYTSVVLVAFASLVAHAELVPARPAWVNDYSVAFERGITQHKPLAVFIGTGEAGWEKISNEGSLSKEAKDLLADRYVCVYVNTEKATGRQLAEAFAISDQVGLIISDQSGKVQAFRHEGGLASRELEKYLKRYSDPDRVALTTETKETLEYRPAPVQPAIHYAAPVRSC
jgi:hypothetical protein